MLFGKILNIKYVENDTKSIMQDMKIEKKN